VTAGTAVKSIFNYFGLQLARTANKAGLPNEYQHFSSQDSKALQKMRRLLNARPNYSEDRRQ
jgi:hypothetical protein